MPVALEAQTVIPTFEEVALEVVKNKKIEWSNPKHAMQWENTLKDYAFPVIGQKTVDQVTMQDILTVSGVGARYAIEIYAMQIKIRHQPGEGRTWS